MSGQQLTTVGKVHELGIVAAVLGGTALICFLSSFILPAGYAKVIFFLYLSPILIIAAFALSLVELIRAKRGKATRKSKFWAELGLVASLLAGAAWIGFYLWLTAFVQAMQRHH